MPVSQVLACTTPSELVGWALYFTQRSREHEKDDYLFANLCARLIETLTGKKAEMEQFLLRYVDHAESKPAHREPKSLDDSKAAWAAAVGITWTPKNNV